MNKIKVLSPEITNLIAAGEVVERPASIVKELAENSIDAGATRIKVVIQGGGRKLVQVIDNGSGMNRSDATLCIQPHATSKIKSEADVESIRTMGFRGEALPSIAAVSNFSLITQTENCKVGTELLVDGGVIKDVRDAAGVIGTNITVRNLFYNMPVRKKFLRSEQTEEIHIQQIVELLALANPEIAFELIIEKKIIIKVNSGTLTERVVLLLGKDWINEMLNVNFLQSDIKISGFVAKPAVSRSSRKDQIFFINRRPVISDVLYHAIRNAYQSMVLKSRYAPVVLFLDMHAGLVDVNVHPQKREVRFRNNMLISEVLVNAINVAIKNFHLNQHKKIITENQLKSPEKEVFIRPNFSTIKSQDLINGKKDTLLQTRPNISAPKTTADLTDLEKIRQTLKSIIEPEKLEKKVETTEKEAIEIEKITTKIPKVRQAPIKSAELFHPTPQHNNVFTELRIIGNLANQYILAEGNDGLVVIDQNAAHRRIIYERILKNSQENLSNSQPLLFPITVDLSTGDKIAINKNQQFLKKIGFEIENFGGNTYIINALPSSIPNENVLQFFQQFITDLSSTMQAQKPDEIQLIKIAAKYAIKEKNLTENEMRNLLKDLSQTLMPYTCPEGAPTMINYAYSELARRFFKKNH